MTNRNQDRSRSKSKRNDSKWAWKKPRINKGFWAMILGVIVLLVIFAVVKSW